MPDLRLKTIKKFYEVAIFSLIHVNASQSEVYIKSSPPLSSSLIGYWANIAQKERTTRIILSKKKEFNK